MDFVVRKMLMKCLLILILATTVSFLGPETLQKVKSQKLQNLKQRKFQGKSRRQSVLPPGFVNLQLFPSTKPLIIGRCLLLIDHLISRNQLL